jgi:hypothetical protein
MWKIIGFYYLVLAPNHFKVIGMEYFETPQDCFLQAMTIMKNEEDPRNMACLPRFVSEEQI